MYFKNKSVTKIEKSILCHTTDSNKKPYRQINT